MFGNQSSQFTKTGLWVMAFVGCLSLSPQVRAQDSKPAAKEPAKKTAKTPDNKKPDNNKADKKGDKKKKPDKVDPNLARRAQKKLSQAYAQAQRAPRKAEALALEALKIYPEYENARSFLGWLYNVVLAENEKAIKQYDHLIRKSKNRKIKADALANKGSLIFIEKRDAKTAIELYKAAYSVYRIWEYADKASNLNLHVGNIPEAFRLAVKANKQLTSYIERLKKKIKALNGKKKRVSQQQLELVEPNLIKVKVNLATCQLMMGKKEEAKKTLEELDEFPRAVKYNLALLRAAQGNRVGTLNCLNDFMLTRQTPKARNLLRLFVEEEPVFKKFHKYKDFQKFLKREKIKDKAVKDGAVKDGAVKDGAAKKDGADKPAEKSSGS